MLTSLKDPMQRNAYALMLGTAITSLLGFVFWILAARWLPTVAVGTGAALFSAMMFLATISTLGLRNSLVRFLKEAGRSAGRVVLTSYGVCLITAMSAALIFVLGQPWWASELSMLRSSPLAPLAFVLATGVWVIFVLEDHVLIGLRLAIWVPVVTGTCAIAKLGLLTALAPGSGWLVIASSVIPSAVAIVIVTVLTLRYLKSQRYLSAASTSRPSDFRVSKLIRFAVGDYISTLILLATGTLMPLVVLQTAGAESSAYYYIAYTITSSLFLVTANMGSALVAEAAHSPELATALTRRAFLAATRLVIPIALVAAVAAPLILRLIGPDYSANGTVLLRLLVLSAIPEVVIGISLSRARILHENRLIVAVYSALAVGVIGGSLLSIGSWGLTGVGVAWLSTQVVLAAVLLSRRGVARELLWPERPEVQVPPTHEVVSSD